MRSGERQCRRLYFPACFCRIRIALRQGQWNTKALGRQETETVDPGKWRTRRLSVLVLRISSTPSRNMISQLGSLSRTRRKERLVRELGPHSPRLVLRVCSALLLRGERRVLDVLTVAWASKSCSKALLHDLGAWSWPWPLSWSWSKSPSTQASSVGQGKGPRRRVWVPPIPSRARPELAIQSPSKHPSTSISSWIHVNNARPQQCSSRRAG